jgi:hypothetical protein
MESATPQRMTIIILSAVLLAAAAVGLVIYFTTATSPQYQEPVTEVPTTTDAPVASGDFNTAVLQSPAYGKLDNSIFTRGLIPVQPPTSAGKPNPFQ